MTSPPRMGDSGVEVMVRSLWCRNSSGAANVSIEEWLEVDIEDCAVVAVHMPW